MAQKNRAQRLNGLFPLSYMGVNPVSPVNFVIDDRAPTINDSKNFYIGDMWLNNANNTPPQIEDLWILVDLIGNNATWVSFASSALTENFVTDNGTAIPAASILNVKGGVTAPEAVANINTYADPNGSNNLKIALNNTIFWPATNAAGTQGALYLDGIIFLHDYGTAGAASGNTFLGPSAGNLTHNSTSMTGIGNGALRSITVSDAVTAVGSGCFEALTTGDNTVCVGANGLILVTTGHLNDGFGTNVGFNGLTGLVTGSFNVLIGSGETGFPSAGSSYTGAESSNIMIRNVGVTGESHVIRIGTDGNGDGQQTECFLAGNLNLLHNILLPNTNTAGTQGIIKFGGDRWIHNYGSGTSNNTFVGRGSGNLTNTSQDTTGIGSFCLENLTSGVENTTVGAGSLQFLSSGTRNCAFGVNAGSLITTANDNVFIGWESGADLAAGAANQNTFVGSVAGANIAGIATNNVLLGYSAGSNYTTTESSNIIIGNTGTIADNNTIRIGTQGAGAGQQNKAFMAGINGVTVASPRYVTIDTVTNQLGTTAASPTLNTAFLAHQNTDTVVALGFYQLGADEALVEVYDVGGNFTPGDGLGTPATFTAPADGYYYLAILTDTFVGGADNQLYHPGTRIVTTTTTYSRPNPIATTALGGSTYGQTSIVAFMNNGDTATFEISGSSTTTFTVVGGASPIVTYCYGYRVG